MRIAGQSEKGNLRFEEREESAKRSRGLFLVFLKSVHLSQYTQVCSALRVVHKNQGIHL